MKYSSHRARRTPQRSTLGAAGKGLLAACLLTVVGAYAQPAVAQLDRGMVPVAMYGQQWLLQQKLEAGKDDQFKAARTDMGVGRMLLFGEAVMAIRWRKSPLPGTPSASAAVS